MSAQIIEREIVSFIDILQQHGERAEAAMLDMELFESCGSLSRLVRIRDSWDMRIASLQDKAKPASMNTSSKSAMSQPYAPGAPIQQNKVDPWQHRSENTRCKTCMWFCPKPGEDSLIHMGRCRRHSPSIGGYPVVFVNDWCGDHRLNENWFANAPF